MLVPDWKRGVSIPLDMQCNLETVFRHMDYICQLAGNTFHIGIGSDLDGAFGTEQCPYDLDTIADLQSWFLYSEIMATQRMIQKISFIKTDKFF